MNRPTVEFQLDRRDGEHTTEVRFMRMKEVLAICGKSRSSVYDAIRKGDFPKPVKLHGRSSAWIKSEIEQWIQECIKASRPE